MHPIHVLRYSSVDKTLNRIITFMEGHKNAGNLL